VPCHVQLLVRIGRVIKFRDEEIDYTDEVVLTDQVLQAVRKSTYWPRSTPSMEPAMRTPAVV
jgi:hypothetical protein